MSPPCTDARLEETMAIAAYTLARFIDDLRRISREHQDPRDIIGAVRPLARDLALARTWLEPHHYRTDATQGFGAHLLHEEPDHTLAVMAAAWLPGRGAPPHNHGTWAVVAGVDGDEANTFWKRLDDGSRPGHADIARQGVVVFGPGEVVSFLPDSIHSVHNGGDRVTVSLHIYGKHLNYTGRSQFDPEKKTETPFLLRFD
jgi:predicted metal-dependent enzyme (double-stranded beta helix superfamily)